MVWIKIVFDSEKKMMKKVCGCAGNRTRDRVCAEDG